MGPHRVATSIVVFVDGVDLSISPPASVEHVLDKSGLRCNKQTMHSGQEGLIWMEE